MFPAVRYFSALLLKSQQRLEPLNVYKPQSL